jgi:hypothetical protein
VDKPQRLLRFLGFMALGIALILGAAQLRDLAGLWGQLAFAGAIVVALVCGSLAGSSLRGAEPFYRQPR